MSATGDSHLAYGCFKNLTGRLVDSFTIWGQ